MSLSVDELEQQLYRYYLHQYNKQRGKVSTPRQSKKELQNYKDASIPQGTSVSHKLDDYFENHKVWVPQFDYEVFPGGKSRGAHVQDEKEYDAFINYVHMPKIIGNEPVPSFVHHTSCSLEGMIYILGGGRTFSREPNVSFINTDNIIIEATELPFPLENRILNHPALIPNRDLYVLSTESSNIARVEVTGDVPPALFCMSSSEITKRHIFYYGGFQFIDKLDKSDDGKITVKRSVLLSNSGYILDTFTLKFRKLELIAHPTILSKSPLTVPRFGHSSTSINIHKCLYDTDFTTPATVFIMGGYKVNSDGEFETIADLWKVEFSTTYKGKHNYLEFGETILATPIINIIDSNLIIPKARAFHIAEIIDSEYMFGKNQPKSQVQNLAKVGIARPSSPDSSYSYDPNKNKRSNRTLIVHGGTSQNDIIGDLWGFDLDDEVWTEVDTYFSVFEENKEGKLEFNDETFQCQVKCAYHRSMILDRYIIFFLGVIPDEYPELKDQKNDIPDISSLLHKMAENSDKKSFNRLLCFNLTSQTWLLIKCFHNFPITPSGKVRGPDVGCIGSTVVGSNSKVVFTGGYLRSNLEDEHGLEDMNILLGSLSVFEFPLGSFTNDRIRMI